MAGLAVLRVFSQLLTIPFLVNSAFTFTIDAPGPRDCAELKALAGDEPLYDGVYRIWPDAWATIGSFEVFCDMTTDGGGWTIVQRRGIDVPQSLFTRTWNEYKNGFGDLRGGFWIGNDRLFALTNQDAYELRIDLQTVKNASGYAKYRKFWVENEGQLYRLHISNYTGNIGDAFGKHNRAVFSTKDQDHDTRESGNCADLTQGGWWFINCQLCNLNGISTMVRMKHGVADRKWNQWTNDGSIEYTEMKIRPANPVVFSWRQ